uniref:AidA n=1 Tax=Ganoderma boninense TaxID=34458 RepID=A0A5K1K0H3_9APHY|nr:AidA [Ganoderma boninense]
MAPSTASSCNRLRIGINQFRLNLLFLSLLFTPVCSRLVNVTVDDTFGDPTSGGCLQYLAGTDDAWNAGCPTKNCGDCHIGPQNLNLSQIYKQTWHDSTLFAGEPPIAITVQFTGSAVYVFNILPNTISGTITTADIAFSIDEESVGHFTRSPDSSSTVLYNQLVYSNTTLSDGPHTLVMTPNSNSTILFDYLIYSAEDDTTSAGSLQHNNNTSSSQLPPFSTATSASLTGTPASEYGTPLSQTGTSSSQPSPPTSQISSSTSQPSSSTGQYSPSDSHLETSTTPPPISRTSIPPSTGGRHDSPRRPSSSTVPLGAIVGAVLGVVLLLGAVVGLFLLLRRNKCRRSVTPMKLRLGPEDVLAHEHDSDSEGGEDGASCDSARPMSVSRTRAMSALLRLLDDSDTTTYNPHTLTRAFDAQLHGPDSGALHTPIRATSVLSESPPSAAAESDSAGPSQLPSKHRGELAQRLEVLRSTRTALSSQTPS